VVQKVVMVIFVSPLPTQRVKVKELYPTLNEDKHSQQLVKSSAIKTESGILSFSLMTIPQ
jgi:hypothetical protein